MSERYLSCLLLGLLGSAGQVLAMSDAEGLADPTRPLKPPAEAPANLGAESRAPRGNYRLSSVLIRPNSRYAVLNGRQVKVGDRLDDVQVIGIEADRAILERQGAVWQVYLHSRSIKSPAKEGGR